ncbi:MAG: type II toxin-antitoxin system Phd/YefM family antitoxin [Patescibacteria group bacterium]
MINTSTITASEARDDLYNIIRKASRGLRAFEIKLRGVSPVVLISKEELEGWLETLDIMASPEEVEALDEARNEKTTISLEDVLKKMKIVVKNEKSSTQKKS